MTLCWKSPRTRAFTLVELLVVISIIALLVAVLLPAVSSVRNQAKTVQVRAQLTTLGQGLEAYRTEDVFGGAYPPSASDKGSDADERLLIADPLGEDPSQEVMISGAHLLLFAMLGADLLGPPGFIDFNHNRKWSDDTHAGNDGRYDGAYKLDNDTREEVRPRYGNGGYVSDNMREKHVRALGELEDTGVITQWTAPNTPETRRLPLFVDPWDRPILYYRANTGAKMMIGTAAKRGIYYQDDNALITGSTDVGESGIDFGYGPLDISGAAAGAVYHRLLWTAQPIPTEDMNDGKYDDSFARFIWDKSVKARLEPVRKDSYLLITAGPDGVYGSLDDITNWSREAE
ncbi:MAG: type II secretion system protein [Phycisphaerae bacterium]